LAQFFIKKSIGRTCSEGRPSWQRSCQILFFCLHRAQRVDLETNGFENQVNQQRKWHDAYHYFYKKNTVQICKYELCNERSTGTQTLRSRRNFT